MSKVNRIAKAGFFFVIIQFHAQAQKAAEMFEFVWKLFDEGMPALKRRALTGRQAMMPIEVSCLMVPLMRSFFRY